MAEPVRIAFRVPRSRCSGNSKRRDGAPAAPAAPAVRAIPELADSLVA